MITELNDKIKNILIEWAVENYVYLSVSEFYLKKQTFEFCIDHIHQHLQISILKSNKNYFDHLTSLRSKSSTPLLPFKHEYLNWFDIEKNSTIFQHQLIDANFYIHLMSKLNKEEKTIFLNYLRFNWIYLVKNLVSHNLIDDALLCYEITGTKSNKFKIKYDFKDGLKILGVLPQSKNDLKYLDNYLNAAKLVLKKPEQILFLKDFIIKNYSEHIAKYEQYWSSLDKLSCTEYITNKKIEDLGITRINKKALLSKFMIKNDSNYMRIEFYDKKIEIIYLYIKKNLTTFDLNVISLCDLEKRKNDYVFLYEYKTKNPKIDISEFINLSIHNIMNASSKNKEADIVLKKISTTIALNNKLENITNINTKITNTKTNKI